MSLVSSSMMDIGIRAPGFTLPNTNRLKGNAEISLQDFKTRPVVLIAFICNHCPYVVHIREAFAGFAREYETKGLSTIAICSNDALHYPDDGPDKMREYCERFDYPFAYLYDEDQSVAMAYGAQCTPDFFLFDNAQELTYRGQFDCSRPGSSTPATGADMRAAVDALLAGGRPVAEQIPSVGCSIKWKD